MKTLACRVYPGLALIVMAAIGFQCAGKTEVGPPPAWLNADAPPSDNIYFYGTGCAPRQITNRYFKRDTALERARVDLAENIYEDIITELSGDTAAVRAIIESALPEKEVVETYTDGDGRLCARVRLARALVEPGISAHQPAALKGPL